MRPIVLFLCLLICISFALSAARAQPSAWEPSPGHTQLPIWPGAPPDAQPVAAAEVAGEVERHPVAGKPWTYVSNVSQPTITVYSPSSKNTGAAVIVFPGGGYNVLAIDLEGTEVCDWLTVKGVTCVLLKYRVPDSGPHHDPKCRCERNPRAPLALEDAQRTISLVRSRAAQWHIDPHRIGVLGFSAGGHLSVATSTHFAVRSYIPADAVDKESCRPDFAVVLYPGHLWSDESKFALNPDIRVNKNTPPTFILQSEDDPVDSINNTLVYYIALKDAKVPAELHVYAHGGHAFGLRRTKEPITEWPQLVENWLRTIEIIEE